MSPDPNFATRSIMLTRFLLLTVAGVMSLVLCGWWLDIAVLRSLHPSWASATFNTAACIILLAGSAWITSLPSTKRRELGRIGAAGLATGIAGLTLLQYSAQFELGIDELLFTLPANFANQLEHPARMSAATALAITSLGTALMVINQSRRAAQGLTIAAFTLASVSMAGYLFGVKSLYEVFIFSSIAAHTSFTLILLATAMFALRPKPGFIMVMLSKTSGGTLSRLLVPSIPFIQILLGWVALTGYRRGYYGIEMAIAIVAIAGTISAIFIIRKISLMLFKSDIQRNQAEEKAQLLAVTDELTGLHNRRGFFMFAEHELAKAKRDGTPLSLFYVDVDGLKEINDSDGHEAGDKLICRAAKILRRNFRESDVIARIGGDEFTVITRDGANPEVIIRRLQNLITTTNQASPNTADLSVSVGAILCNTPEHKHLSLTRCLAAADKKMYRNKQAKAYRLTSVDKMAG